MATRFYFPAEGSGTPNISPAFDAGWEQTGQATRLKLLDKKQLSALSTITATGTRTVPLTTTQDILCNQFVSDPIPPQRIDASNLFSLITTAITSNGTTNCTLAVVVRVVSQDGTIVRGTLFSVFGTDTAWSGASQTTYIVNNAAVTALTTLPGDRIVVEVGARTTSSTGSGTYTLRQGNDNAADYALTSSLTTILNPWCEFSKDLFTPTINNFQSVAVGNGMSVSERTRY